MKRTIKNQLCVLAIGAALTTMSGCNDDDDLSDESAQGEGKGAVTPPTPAGDAGTAPQAPTIDASAPRSPVDTASLLGLDASSFPYIYFERDKVLLTGIDFDATLKIAEIELAKGGATSVLTIWTMRDQIFPVGAAKRVNDLYLQYIDGEGLHRMQMGLGVTFGHDFAVWHFAWAIGNIYRLGGDDIKAAIKPAYDDALNRPDTLNPPYGTILQEHLTADQIYMGDAHDGGRSYARSHIVIPGNPAYLQSFGDYGSP